MRQPILLGLRKDKPAHSVRRESPQVVKEVKATRTPARPSSTKNGAADRSRGDGTLALTNLDKVYWPEEGYTKGDLISYYREVSQLILPYLSDRLLSLLRHPDGISGKGFFQKDVSRNPPPPWVETAMIPSESTSRTGRYVICQNAETLLYLANLGCIELNPWNARVGSQDRPDYLVIDLDPLDVPFARVTETAVAVRKVLEKADITGLCKTSGKRGLHVFAPLGSRYTHDESRQFAELVAQLVHRELPGITSLVRDPRQRRGRVYLDYLQNRRGQTVVAPYSVRPQPGATVSTPLAWREVSKRLDPGSFTMKNFARRLDRVGDLWRPILGPGADLSKSLAHLASQLPHSHSRGD